ncbi:MAG: aspartate aminotransferase family protein, partial [Nitrosopumilaceae archaeon]
VNSISSMFQIFFTNTAVTDYVSAKKSDTKKFKKLFKSLLQNGIFTAPSQFETVFLSDAHTLDDLHKTIEAYDKSLKAVKS